LQLGPAVIVTLKIAVLLVTVLFVLSLVALARHNYRLHGRINLVFFILTMVAVLGLEVLIRTYTIVTGEDLFKYLDTTAPHVMMVHLCFSIPSAVVLPFMLYLGRSHRRSLHVSLGILFSLLWTGTFITGIFFLPPTLTGP
jgi:uncharacterized membrane protein YozB (DUF420 family)